MPIFRQTTTPTDQPDGWVKPQIQAGHDSNAIGHTRHLTRHQPERPAQTNALRAALIEGENSGPPQRFDLQAFKARMAAAQG